MENPYKYYGGRGFRSCLDDAVRAWNEGRAGNETDDNGIDGAAVVNYATFKRKLRKYSQRRTKLRRLMEGNESVPMIAEDVMAILHFSDDDNDVPKSERVRRNLSVSSPGGCYLPMDDEDDAGIIVHNCNGEIPGIWKRRKRLLHRRGVLREVSSLERKGVAKFLADETRRIVEVYRSQTRLLDDRFVEWRTKIWYELDRSLLSKPSMRLRIRSNSIDNNDNIVESDNDLSYVTKDMIRQTLALGKALLDIEAFCAINILVVRQTLLRYDAFARSFEGTPMMQFYLKTVLRSITPHNGERGSPNLYHHELRQILLHKEVTSICSEFARHLDWVCRENNLSERQSKIRGDHALSGGRTTTRTEMTVILQTIADRFQRDREEVRRLVLSLAVDKTPILMTKPATSTITESFVDVVDRSFILGMYMEDQFGWYLNGTLTRGQSLTEEMRSLTKWKRQSQRIWSMSREGMLKGCFVSIPEEGTQSVKNSDDGNTCGVGLVFLEGLECGGITQCGNENQTNDENERWKDVAIPSKNGSDDCDTNMVTKQQKFNLFMALTGGFLYCMNYYIVEPSSTMYVNALGAHDAAGATLIGMMPIASFLSAIVYSIWTNTVFRQPFLVSCSLMVTGNVIYSMAFNYKSLRMALIGRFLTGLGGPKMIVRRYMADTTSMSIRTSINAGFGMVVAAGSALGPGCAILLSNLDFILPLPGGSELWFNSMTGPGWFMATLWSFFSIALFWGFREQDRIGLAEKIEQDKMEQHNEKLRQEQETENSSITRIADGIPEDRSANTYRIEDGIPEYCPALGTELATSTDQNPMSVHGGGMRPSLQNANHKNGNSVTYAMAVPSSSHLKQTMSVGDESIRTILVAKSSMSMTSECYHENIIIGVENKDSGIEKPQKSLWVELQNVSRHFLFPVRICMGLLFAKVFVIETLVSCTSVLSKNRYGWTIHQVGLLGCANGFFVIPISIVVGKLSLKYQDRHLMVCLLAVGITGLCLLVDVTDLIDTGEAPRTYNKYMAWSVGPIRYVIGYFITYLSIQSFEGIIGSALSKLIPTALAQGTFNSGLLATLVDTFGRSCGDFFISLMGILNIRQLMNLLFVPGVMILATCLVIVRRYYDLLAV